MVRHPDVIGETMFWHYTPAVGMAGILDGKKIAASTVDLARNETPATWFSSDQHWERTAAEVSIRLISGETVTIRTADGQAAMAMGLYRLGLPEQRLMSYPKCCKALGINQRRIQSMNAVARSVGARPSQWAVMIGDVGINDPDLVFSHRLDQEWHVAPIADAARILQENQKAYATHFQTIAAGGDISRMKQRN